jgi:hypothetical protein
LSRKSIAGDRQSTAVRHRVERVLNDVIYHLRQTVSITFDDNALWGGAGCDYYPCALSSAAVRSIAQRLDEKRRK